MTLRIVRIFLLTLWIYCLISPPMIVVGEEIELSTRIREEAASYTVVESIAPSLSHLTSSSSNTDQLHFLADSTTFFTVDASSGEVKVARLIDRERLCPDFQLCCGVVGDGKCQLKLGVLVTNKSTGEFVASIKVVVGIDDRNDNRPLFASPTQTVQISEASPVGTWINLKPASDADIDPVNQVQKYAFDDKSGTFVLDSLALPNIRIQSVRPLDRELRSRYEARLEACDPASCTSQTVEILVLDENDNLPTFSQRHLSFELDESLPVGSQVLQLNATDPDSGERGRVKYQFKLPIDSDLADTFDLLDDSGELRLKRPLAAHIRARYQFQVVACDAADTGCSGQHDQSTVDIELIIKDVNNFQPSIHAVSAGSSGSGGVGGAEQVLSIRENFDPSPVAVVTVKDNDIGENARVECALNEQSSSADFILSPIATNIYSLRSRRRFDYEIEPQVTVKVECHDFGQPGRLTAARLIEIQVIDENEFQPEFTRRVYTGRVAENSPAGLEVVRVEANDRDRGSQLRYLLANGPAMNSSSRLDDQAVGQYFVVEPETGIIRTSHIALDREQMSSVRLTVLVTDSLLPLTYTATTTASIEILDENDNAPVFTNPPTLGETDALVKPFTVSEKAPRFTKLSEKLEANDPDQGDNGRIQFSLLSTYALSHTTPLTPDFMRRALSSTQLESHQQLEKVDQPVFHLTSDGGIETLTELDRESTPAYLIKVGVRDMGSQPLASTTLVLVKVLDQNDNSPQWVFPTLTDKAINLTTAMRPGSLAGRLRAEDPDADLAGLVNYILLGPQGQPVEKVSIDEGLYASVAEYRRQLLNPASSSSSTPKADNQSPTRTKPSGELNGYRLGPFYLNGSTGEIWIAKQLTAGAVSLHLRAQDRDVDEPMRKDAWLTINVFTDPNELGGFGFLGDNTLNVAIILTMITITAIVSLFLIIGIVCVRRKPVRYSTENHATVPPGGMVYSDGTGPNLDMGHDKEMTTNWVQYQSTFNPNTGGPSPTPLYFEDPISGGAYGVNGYSYAPAAAATLGDNASMIYVPSSANGGGMTPVQFDYKQGDYASRGQMSSFGTLSRMRPTLYQGPPNSGGGMGLAYEPHLDADSGDSGRGPSEEGNQFLMTSDGPRNGPLGPLSMAYRPSPSRVAYYRTLTPVLASDESNLVRLHPNPQHCPNPSRTGLCECYAVLPSDPNHQYQPYSPQSSGANMEQPPNHFVYQEGSVNDQQYFVGDYNHHHHQINGDANPEQASVDQQPKSSTSPVRLDLRNGKHEPGNAINGYSQDAPSSNGGEMQQATIT